MKGTNLWHVRNHRTFGVRRGKQGHTIFPHYFLYFGDSTMIVTIAVNAGWSPNQHTTPYTGHD